MAKNCRNINTTVTNSPRFTRQGKNAQAAWLYLHNNIPNTYIGQFDEETIESMFGEGVVKELEKNGFIIVDRENGLYFMEPYWEANHLFWANENCVPDTIKELSNIRDSFLCAILYFNLATCKTKDDDHLLKIELEKFKNSNPSIIATWKQDIEKLRESSMKKYIEWKKSGSPVADA